MMRFRGIMSVAGYNRRNIVHCHTLGRLSTPRVSWDAAPRASLQAVRRPVGGNPGDKIRSTHAYDHPRLDEQAEPPGQGGRQDHASRAGHRRSTTIGSRLLGQRRAVFVQRQVDRIPLHDRASLPSFEAYRQAQEGRRDGSKPGSANQTLGTALYRPPSFPQSCGKNGRRVEKPPGVHGAADFLRSPNFPMFFQFFKHLIFR